MAGPAFTALFARKQPGGVFTIQDMEAHPAQVFFVDSGHAAAADSVGAGWSPDKPCATLDYAIGLCTASQGDVIYVMPGHAENITTAGAIDCDVAGISIIGLGTGNLLPTFTATAAAGSLKIDAANVLVRNIRLTAGFATGCTNAIDITANALGCTLQGVQCRDTTTNIEWLAHALVAAAVTDLLVEGCSFVGLAGTMLNSWLFAGATTDCVFTDCVWFVDSSDSVVDHSATAAINFRMERCKIVNADTGAANHALELKTASTGLIADNRFAYNKVDSPVAIGDAAWWFQNYASNTIAQSGLLHPTTAHAIP